jgi:hypothetical protein
MVKMAEIKYLEAIHAMEKFKEEHVHVGELTVDDFYMWCCQHLAAQDGMTPLKKGF